MKNTYLFLEPYVHVSLKRNRALLYNTLNGKALEYKDKPNIIKILKRLLAKNNLFVIKLLKRDMENPDILSFINDVRVLLMGDLLDGKWLSKKPVQVSPGVKILEEISKALDDDFTLVALELMSNINEIYMYINDSGDWNFNGAGIYRHAYKQFPCPVSGSGKRKELPLEYIKKILMESEVGSLFKVNILGGDIFTYSAFNELAGILSEKQLIKSYHVHYRFLENNEEKLQQLKKCSLSEDEGKLKWELNMFADFPVHTESFHSAMKIAGDSGIKTIVHFIIKSDEEILLAEELLEKYNILDYSIHPFYTGKNLGFFEENVFLNRHDILASHPSQKDILSRGVLNQTNFGKLVVFHNGNVHANVNAPVLGNIGKDSLHDIVFKELRQNTSWKKTRSALEPCRSCLLQYLCPSPSNYESVLGRNNLCDYFPDYPQPVIENASAGSHSLTQATV